MDISLLLELAADGMGDSIAIGSADDGISYAALRARARSAASILVETGAANTVFLGGNGLAFPIALFASAYAGRPLVPLNYRLPDADLRRILARCAPAVAIVDDDMLPRIADIAGITPLATSAFLSASGEAPAVVEPASNEIAVLLFTSGTTGEPKAAVLRHENLTSYVLSSVDFMGSAFDGQAALVSVPPYHIAGISAVLTSVYGGRRIIYMHQFSAEGWVKAAARGGATHAMLVPTMLGRVLEVIERDGTRLSGLRHLSYGGGRMPATLVERALTLLPDVDFVNAYGLTETSSTIAVLTPADHRNSIASSDPVIRRRLGSVGRPLPAIELRIMRNEDTECSPGEPGEIWVRGEQVSGEYLSHRAIRDDGWFPTNDHGWLDDEGYLFVTGRLDDVIVRGGENISPGEIEDVLRRHPAVADVAVLGVPDDEWGERIVAVVVPQAAVEAGELTGWVRERLRSTKTPDLFLFRSELPYNETGKLLRRALKAELETEAAN